MKTEKVAAQKLVHGVGINDADYAVRKVGWVCPFYQAWASMLKRCYCIKTQRKQPAYVGCTVSSEWLTFSNFRAWMVTQDWQGMQLDKDLLFEGNKVYSTETCIFVPKMVNTFIIDRAASRGEWLVGVCWHKGRSKFMSQCRNTLTKKQEYLGLFACEQEAHNAWLKRKLELAYELAEIQTDTRVAKALINRYTNYL